MFASQTTKVVPLPSDASVLVTIRKLAWPQRKKAQRAAQKESMRDLVDMGGAAFMRTVQEMRIDMGKPETDSRLADPLLTHDQALVLLHGVASWTSPVALSVDALNDLDSEDAEFLAREILILSLPPAPAVQEKKDATFIGSSTETIQ